MTVSGETEHGVNRAAHSLEFLLFDGELLPTGGCQPIVPRAAVVVGDSPLGLHITVEQEALQSGVEGAFADLQHVFGHPPKAFSDPIAVQRLALQRAKNQKIESAGQKLRL